MQGHGALEEPALNIRPSSPTQGDFMTSLRSGKFGFSPKSLGKGFLFVAGVVVIAKEFRALWGQLLGLWGKLKD